MYGKQISKKFLLISISVLASLALCMCAIFGTSKSAEAKANPSNDFGLTFWCSPEYRLTGYYEDIEDETNDTVDITYDDNVTSFDYWDYIQTKIKDRLGVEPYLVCEESYYLMAKPSMNISKDNDKVLSLNVTLLVGIEGFGTAEFGATMKAMDSPTHYANVPWIINGTEVSNEPTLFTDDNYKFTVGKVFNEINISGNVVDEAGNAVDGAKVSVTPENTANAVVPDPVMTVNGTFTFENVDPEILPAMINVEKDGYTFTPVRITENDIVDGKIIVSNLVLKQAVQPANEIAQTSDVTASFALALLLLAMCGCAVVLTRAFKNQK